MSVPEFRYIPVSVFAPNETMERYSHEMEEMLDRQRVNQYLLETLNQPELGESDDYDEEEEEEGVQLMMEQNIVKDVGSDFLTAEQWQMVMRFIATRYRSRGFFDTIVRDLDEYLFDSIDQQQREYEYIDRGPSLLEKERYIHRNMTRKPPMVEDCLICQENFESNMICVECNSCHRPFHDSCMFAWLRKKTNCPNCRKECEDSELLISFSFFITNIGMNGETPEGEERQDPSEHQESTDPKSS